MFYTAPRGAYMPTKHIGTCAPPARHQDSADEQAVYLSPDFFEALGKVG